MLLAATQSFLLRHSLSSWLLVLRVNFYAVSHLSASPSHFIHPVYRIDGDAPTARLYLIRIVD